MATEFKLPALGENIESGDVVKVLVAVGDSVQKDQPILEIETDKAVIEVPSPGNGTIIELHIKEGETAKVGQLIMVLDGDGAEAPANPEPAKKEAARPEEKPAEKPAPSKAEAPETPAAKKPDLKVVKSAAPNGGKAAPASPSVRRLAREIGVDINMVPGSGPGGRISADDVKEYSKAMNAGTSMIPAAPVQVSGEGTAVPSLPLPDFSQWGEVEVEEMNNVRRKTAAHMSYAWATIPHVTNFDKADITELESLRKKFGKKAEEAGGKLTVTAISLKVIAAALKVFPKFNSSIDVANNKIINKKYYNIGVAVDTDRGLLVPVIKDVDKKNIIEISAELNEAAAKARERKASPEDLSGGTFTITNLGGLGAKNFTPIINPPEVAILAISRGAIEPVYVDGQFVPRMMMPLALSYDHRLIDGADATRFLRWVAEALEQPFLLSLEG